MFFSCWKSEDLRHSILSGLTTFRSINPLHPQTGMSNLIRDETREESEGSFESGGARGVCYITRKRFSTEKKGDSSAGTYRMCRLFFINKKELHRRIRHLVHAGHAACLEHPEERGKDEDNEKQQREQGEEYQ